MKPSVAIAACLLLLNGQLVFAQLNLLSNVFGSLNGPLEMISVTDGFNAREVVGLLARGTTNSLNQIANAPYPTDIYVTVYCQNNGSAAIIVDHNDTRLQTKIDVKKDVVFILHGWMDSIKRNFVVNTTLSKHKRR